MQLLRPPLAVGLALGILVGCQSAPADEGANPAAVGQQGRTATLDDEGFARDGVDIFLAANDGDDGTQPDNRLSSHWESPDIKVDSLPYERAPATSQEFDSLANDAFVPGEVSRIYVRVRSRGSEPPGEVTVRLYSSTFGTLLPTLTDEPAKVTSVEFGEREWAIAVLDMVAPEVFSPHQCLLVAAEAGGDSLSRTFELNPTGDQAILKSNNVVARNMDLVALKGGLFNGDFVMANPAAAPGKSILAVEAPDGWRVSLEGIDLGAPFDLRSGDQKTVRLSVDASAASEFGAIRVRQQLTLDDGTLIGGGVTFFFGP